MTADVGGPGAPRFDVVLRGYDRKQVDEHVARLQRVLGRMRADLETARSQPLPLVPPPGFGPGLPPPPPGPGLRPRPAHRPRGDEGDPIGTFTDRMQNILAAAEEEAAEIRGKARAAARAERESVRAELADLVRQRDALRSEVARMRGQLDAMRSAVGAGPGGGVAVGGPGGGPAAGRPGPAGSSGPSGPGGDDADRTAVDPGAARQQPGKPRPGAPSPAGGLSPAALAGPGGPHVGRSGGGRPPAPAGGDRPPPAHGGAAGSDRPLPARGSTRPTPRAGGAQPGSAGRPGEPRPAGRVPGAPLPNEGGRPGLPPRPSLPRTGYPTPEHRPDGPHEREALAPGRPARRLDGPARAGARDRARRGRDDRCRWSGRPGRRAFRPAGPPSSRGACGFTRRPEPAGRRRDDRGAARA